VLHTALALSTRITTTVGQPGGAHEGLRARADAARDVPSGSTVLDDRGATGLPVSNQLTYSGAAMVFGYMESLLEEHNVGFKVHKLFGYHHFLAIITFNISSTGQPVRHKSKDHSRSRLCLVVYVA
jgi:hypothetical protein